MMTSTYSVRYAMGGGARVPSVARLMRAAVGGDNSLLKVSRELGVSPPRFGHTSGKKLGG